MPIAVVAGKSGGIEADDEAGIPEANLGNQLPEACSLDATGSGFAEVFINDMHPLVRPAESDGTIDEPIL